MYTFKIANTPDEFDQIHSLNYRTFVEELGQHPENKTGKLVDKFHTENTYIIGKHGERIVAMVATRSNRPFSLDHKIPDLDQYLPPHEDLMEIRLFSIDPEHRKGRVFKKLILELFRHFIQDRTVLFVISAIQSQEKLYRGWGFVPFHAPMPSGKAIYTPMYRLFKNYQWLSADGKPHI